MTIQSARQFIEKLKNDDGFLAQLIKCDTASKKMEFTIANGYDFSIKEIKKLKAQFTDDDLASRP